MKSSIGLGPASLPAGMSKESGAARADGVGSSEIRPGRRSRRRRWPTITRAPPGHLETLIRLALAGLGRLYRTPLVLALRSDPDLRRTHPRCICGLVVGHLLRL